MNTQLEIRVLTPDQRANLKRLAEAATKGPYRAVHMPHLKERPSYAVVSDEAGQEIARQWGSNDALYQAELSPDLTLGTLAYVEQLEREVADLRADQIKQMEGGLDMKQFILAQGEELNEAKRRVSSLQKELADQERAALGWAQELARKERILKLYHRKMFAMLNIGSMGFADFEAGWGGVVDLMDAKGRAEKEAVQDFICEVDAARPTDAQLDAEIQAIDPAAPVSPSSQDPAGAGAPACWCQTCQVAYGETLSAIDRIRLLGKRMIVCPDCGNKRCPKANFHGNACTNSNVVGQKGSSWENVKPFAAAPQGEETRREEVAGG